MRKKLSFIIIIVFVIIAFTGCNEKVSREKIYYGEWITTSSVYYAPISAMTEEEYNRQHLGKVASYSTEKAKFSEVVMDNPVYKEKILNEDEFYEEYRVSLDHLGIKDNQALIVHIGNWDNPGALLIVKEGDTMISLWDGLFFELKRK